MSRQVRFDQVNALQQRGWSQLVIQREIGTDLKTIRKWLKDGQPGTWQRKAPKPRPKLSKAIFSDAGMKAAAMRPNSTGRSVIKVMSATPAPSGNG